MKFETLSPDTMYEAAVRVKVKKSTALYNSTWSKWSMPVTWTTHKGKAHRTKPVGYLKNGTDKDPKAFINLGMGWT